MFFAAMAFFSYSVLNLNALECVSMNNQECKIRSGIIDINSNEHLFYPCSSEINKCSGNCNNINDSYAKLCIADVFKNVNVKSI